MNEYDEKRQSTPVIAACASNSIETLKVLLKHGANPNVFYDPNKIKKTTMHFAAEYANIEMMKLLINHGFECGRLINNIYYSEHHASVFLILCSLGNVQCMDYLISYCEQNNYSINFKQKTVESMNGLQAAIYFEQLEMVEYLLTKVYDNDKKRKEIMDQRVGIMDWHIFELAASNSTQDALEIFKLLRKYKWPKDTACVMGILEYAAFRSPLIFEYMLNEKLYPVNGHAVRQLVTVILVNASGIIIYQNIAIAVKYLHCCFIKEICSLKLMKYLIVNILCDIMEKGTFDGYFGLIAHLIEILLDSDDWRNFIKSDLIDKQVLQQIRCKIAEQSSAKDKTKWSKLLDTMCKSIDEADSSLLREYDCQDDTKSDDDYTCNDCGDAGDIVSQLNTLLKNKEFEQFSLKLQLCKAKSNVIDKVTYILSTI